MTPDKTQAASAQPKPGDATTAFIVAGAGSDSRDTTVINPNLGSASDTAQAWVGKSLGKYQVTGMLGQGGMGVVVKAHDPMIERDVAIKVLADHLVKDATALNRFLGEAKAAGKLNHPNVIAIYEI